MKKSSLSILFKLIISVFLVLIINSLSSSNLFSAINLNGIHFNQVYAQENQVDSSTENQNSEISSSTNQELENNQTSATETDNSGGENSEIKKENKPVMVRVDGQDLFSLAIQIGELTVEDRVKAVEERIIKVAEDKSILPEDLNIASFDDLKLIQADDIIIVAFSQADAEVANQSLSVLAQERLEIIKNSIIEYRQARTEKSITRGIITTIIATILLLIAWIILNRTLPHYFQKFQQWQQQKFNSVRFQGLQFLSRNQISKLISITFNLIRFFLIFLLLYIYIPLVLSSFPLTKPYGVRLLRAFWNAVNLVGFAILSYIPNLFIIGLIGLIAYYSLRFARLFFNAIKSGRIRLKGFYPEWAEPTYKITIFLIAGLAAVLIFPYLPASDSAGFQGISLFAGALVTFGSTAVISNIVSGIVLIYTRSFQVGDMIRANNYTGKVVEKTMLSTRILTPDNEIITIPNGSLIASEITNYTASLRDQKQPLIVKTTITLGYDVPWRKVHEVLVNAAQASEEILSNPEPFVFQTSLDDYYVAYTIKAYTDKPEKMGFIYSQLHQNIQDKCNEADIEILSPHYRAIRDGHQTTIPADYLPDDYQVPSFRVKSE